MELDSQVLASWPLMKISADVVSAAGRMAAIAWLRAIFSPGDSADSAVRMALADLDCIHYEGIRLRWR